MERQIEQDQDQHQRSETTITAALRPPAFAGIRRSIRLVRRLRDKPAVLPWASATVLARSRPRTPNLTAISRLPLLAGDRRGTGRTKLPRIGLALSR